MNAWLGRLVTGITAEVWGQSQTSSCDSVVNKVAFIEVSVPVLEFYPVCIIPPGDRGGTVVKVLRYKSEGRWFDSR